MVDHIITSEGLASVSLGLMQEDYVPFYIPWINKRIGIEGTLQRPPYSLESGKAWVRGLDETKGKEEVFAILKHDTSHITYIGHTGLHKINRADGFAGTGSIMNPIWQGKGYGTEAKLLLQHHAFMVLGLRKLTSSVKAWNAQSLGHLIKCGYQVIGRHKSHHFHEGTHCDEILLEVFREEWEPIWAKYQKTKELPDLNPKQRKLIEKEISK